MKRLLRRGRQIADLSPTRRSRRNLCRSLTHPQPPARITRFDFCSRVAQSLSPRRLSATTRAGNCKSFVSEPIVRSMLTISRSMLCHQVTQGVGYFDRARVVERPTEDSTHAGQIRELSQSLAQAGWCQGEPAWGPGCKRFAVGVWAADFSIRRGARLGIAPPRSEGSAGFQYRCENVVRPVVDQQKRDDIMRRNPSHPALRGRRPEEVVLLCNKYPVICLGRG